jgi:hypothetical protein
VREQLYITFTPPPLKKIIANQGSYVLSGKDVTLTYAQPLLLDIYTGAKAGYSFRKLRDAYSGNCLRVRRSSDNTEQDIGFSGNYLDTASMMSFVGSSVSAYLVTWYDQSGNGYNVTQSSASLQPFLKSSSTYVTKNGFTSSRHFNNSLLFVNGMLTAYPINNFIVATNESGSDGGIIISGSEDTSSNFQYFADYINRSTYNASLIETAPTEQALNIGTKNNGVLVQASFLHKSISDKIVGVNGTSTSSTSFTQNIFPIDNFAIGTVKRPVGLTGTAGFVSEVIVYNTDQSANQSNIESNQKSYYST